MNTIINHFFKFKLILLLSLMLVKSVVSFTQEVVDSINTVTINGDNVNKANDMFIDKEENIYITGSFAGSITIDGATFQANGDSDAFIVKFDERGKMLWFNQAGSGFFEKDVISERGQSVQVDEEGNVYVCGVFMGEAKFCNTTVKTKGGADIFLVKYNASGKLSWVQTLGNEGYDACNNLIIENKRLLLSGITNSSHLSPKERTINAFLASFDFDGNRQWYQEDITRGMISKTQHFVDNGLIYWFTQKVEMNQDSVHNFKNLLKIEIRDIDGQLMSAKKLTLENFLAHGIQRKNEDSFIVTEPLSKKTAYISDLILKSNASSVYPLVFADSQKISGNTSQSLSCLPKDKDNVYSIDSSRIILVDENNELIYMQSCGNISIQQNVSRINFVKQINVTSLLSYVLINYIVNQNSIAFGESTSLQQKIMLLKISGKNDNLVAESETNLIEQYKTQIFPNPSQSGLFNILYDESLGKANLSIYDSKNKLVKHIQEISSKSKIDLQQEPAGLYSVVIAFDNFQEIRKIVKL